VRTPSIRNRVTGSGVAVVAVLLAVFGTFVVLSLQARLESNLDELIAARARIAGELAETYGTERLPELLLSAGIPAIVTDPNGTVRSADPVTPRFGSGPPAAAMGVEPPYEQRLVILDDGTQVEVLATRAGIGATMRSVILLVAAGTLAGTLVALVLFRRVAAYALDPLDDIVAVAGRTAAGEVGARLAPEDPDTELGRLALAYDQMVDGLEAALAEARDTEERTRRFVDDAAHQLRTPLATIRGSVEALLQERDPHVRDRLLANLVREAARANRLLTSLLTLARLDQGRPTDPGPTDLSALCRDELSRTLSLAPHLRIDLDADPASGGTWELDDHATREILANLLDNARRHAASRITVERRLVRDEPPGGGDEAGWRLELSVRDDGAGIPDGASELVFERFATLDGQGGSGLGLPIARRLARAQGGDLVLRDGAFVLHLPAERPQGG
jgi:two-component system, OmpR family, sensor kinase